MLFRTHSHLPALLRLAPLIAAALLCAPLSAVFAQKTPKVEDLVERSINSYGTRAALYQVQKNGILRAQVKLFGADGAVREGRAVTKFIRKPKLLEDLVLIELELPDTNFTIGFDGQKTWAVHNGERQEPSPELTNAFRSAYAHSYEALLRYKETGSQIEYVTTNKIGTLELDVIDLVAPDGQRTRYNVSRRSGHILALEYETKPTPEAKPNKYRLTFSDFQVIQNSLVPYKTVVYENEVKVEERKIVEVAYNVQLEEKAFRTDADKPAETAAKP
jgi:hypothetical protein